MKINTKKLEERINEWKEKVLKAANSNDDPRTVVDTYAIICDIDKIIAEEFDRRKCLEE